MSRFFLLRHAQSIANEQGFLAGRLPDINLSKKGIAERKELHQRLAGSNFDLLLTSPIDRCLQTIEGFGRKQQLLIDSGITEVDYGIWTGKKFSSLRRNPEWKKIIRSGSKITFAKGESVKAVQKRAVQTLLSYENRKNKNILVSTHADVVKFAIFHALGVSLDNLDRLHIDNASISVIDLNKGEFTVRAVNDRSSMIKEYLL